VPNWCENIVKFSGNKEKITKLADRLTKPVKVVRHGSLAVLSYDQPPWEYGDEFKSDIPPGGHAMSRTVIGINKDAVDRHWMTQIMGTKWDFDIDLKTVDDSNINGYFNSAWSPPEGWFTHVCEEYEVDGELSYGEGGNDFAGILEVREGVETNYSSRYHPWAMLHDSSPQEYLDNLIEELRDCDEVPSTFEALRQDYEGWPKSWEEYKQRYRHS
jgi:hypothetical protein